MISFTLASITFFNRSIGIFFSVISRYKLKSSTEFLINEISFSSSLNLIFKSSEKLISNFRTFEISFVILFPPIGIDFKNWNLLLLKNKALVRS